DAEEIVNNFNGKTFLGSNIIIEFAKENRRRDNFDDRGGRPPPRSRRPAGFRVVVSGLSRDTSWQDLKDFAREAGSVSFADVDRDAPNQGVIEYVSQSDAENAVRILDGRDLRGAPVRVTADDRPAGGRDRDRDRDRDYHRDERSSGGRDRDRDRDRDHYRRDRSRSPRRSDYEYRDRERRDYDRRDDRRDDKRDRRSPRRDDRDADNYDRRD
ncbi:hypothetical protein FRC12_015001, partial [Ceratobasidium sp. 428]